MSRNGRSEDHGALAPGEACRTRAGGSVRMPLHRIAHGRSGDKGNRQNISVIVYDAAHWPLVLKQVTEERVLACFAHRGASRCTRYVLPNLCALNFVIDDALEGGVNSALALDTHGKTTAFRVLAIEVEVPEALAGAAKPPLPTKQAAKPPDSTKQAALPPATTEQQEPSGR